MTLNPEQQKAASIINGKVLVLAGAGTGKTKVITHRIAHLIQNNIPPSSILGLTFTNKAAKEMRHRLASLLNETLAKKVTLSTFHSFCMQILRKEAASLDYSPHFSLYDEKDMLRLTTQLAREILQTEKDIPSLAPALEAISKLQNKHLPKESLKTGSPWHDQFLQELYEKLQASLKTYNAVTFDSLLSLALELFEKNPKILEKYQDRFRYILIDEYQDTNPVQYQLATLLSNKYQNLFVVGDDDQAIYSFRGSSIEHILHFPADVKIKLEQNYRSTPSILQAANSVIQNNKHRHDKKLWSAKAFGEKLTLFHAPTDVEEAQSVVQKIISLKKEKNLHWKDFAILYRSNALSRNIELALLQAVREQDGKWLRSIPYEIYGGLEFSERSEIKDILAYLRLIANPKDQEALLRIINVPRRAISPQTVEILSSHAKQHQIPIWTLMENLSSYTLPLTPKAQNAILSFVSIIQQAKKRFSIPPLHPSLKWLLETINYKKAIEEETKNEQAKIYKWENAQETINALAEYEQTAESPSLQDFVGTTLLSNENAFSPASSSEDKVQLMTFHSSKGLEFKACFLIALEDHILPHEKSLKDTGLEEERRLFYVALTRSMQYISLSMSRSRRKSGSYVPTNPSRFLSEIPKDLLTITSWK